MPYLQSFQAGGKPFQIPEGFIIHPFPVWLKIVRTCSNFVQHKVLFLFWRLKRGVGLGVVRIIRLLVQSFWDMGDAETDDHLFRTTWSTQSALLGFVIDWDAEPPGTENFS